MENFSVEKCCEKNHAQGLWKKKNFFTPVCGKKAVAISAEKALFHINFSYYCYDCLIKKNIENSLYYFRRKEIRYALYL